MDRDDLVLEHLPRVRMQALKFRRRLPACVEINDLVSDGIVGLLQAANAFDPGRGLQFWTFAQSRVRGAMVDGIRTDQGKRKYLRDRPLVVALSDDYDQVDPSPSPLDRALRASHAREVARTVRRTLRQVRPREAAVFVASVRGESLEAIGRRLGFNQSRASQLRARVVRALRAARVA